MAYRFNPKTGEMENSVFDHGHEITDEEIRRSRGYRREALKEAQALQRQGFMRVDDLKHINYVIRSACLNIWPQDCLVSARTEYNPRGYYGKPELRREKWIKAPVDGVDPWQVMKVADINFESRPQYRATWEAKLALEMSPEEIEVFLMMFMMGGKDEG